MARDVRSRFARFAAGAVGIVALAVAVVAAVHWLTGRNGSEAGDRSRQLAAVVASFRPWTRNIGDPAGSARVVVLLDSGNVDISAWKFRLRPNLPADDVPGIDRIVKQTRTRFRLVTSRGRSYGLDFWQPFVVESEPSRVYVVRRVAATVTRLSRRAWTTPHGTAVVCRSGCSVRVIVHLERFWNDQVAKSGEHRVMTPPYTA